tara:strand:- start:9067 stop:11010 length:1944 start_codon:yes stop_codon:yes gene_type:complete
MQSTFIYSLYNRASWRWTALILALIISGIDQWFLAESIDQLNSWTDDVFKLMNFQYLMLAMGIWLAFYGAGQKEIRNRSFILFLASSLLILYWTPLGFDLTDEGRRMSFAYYFMDNYEFHLVDFKFGSHFISYLWLHLVSLPSVIWMRIGFLLSKTFLILILYKILEKYVPIRFAFIASIVGALLTVTYADQVLDYNNLPALIVALSLLTIEEGFLSHSFRRNSLFILSGTLITLAILSKLPVLFILPLLTIYILVRPRKNIAGTTKYHLIGFFLLGFIASYTLFLGLLKYNDQAGVYFSKIYSVVIEPFFMGVKNEAADKLSRHGHDPSSLKSQYIDHSILVATHAWKYSLALLPLFVFWKNEKRWFINLLWAVFVGFVAVNFDISNWMPEFLAISICLWVLALRSALSSMAHTQLILLQIGLTIVLFIGTNNGFLNIFISGGIAFLFVSSIATMLHFGRLHRIGIIGLLMLIAFFAWSTKSHTIYRNLDQPYLTTAFQSPELSGIYATQPRVLLMDSTLTAMKEAINYDKEATMLDVNTVPGFNYLLQVKQSSLLFWKLNDMSKPEKVALLQSDVAPKYLVFSKINTRLRYWPNLKQVAYTPNDSAAFTFFDNYLHRSNPAFKPIYANKAFELWEKKDVNGEACQ